MLDFGTPDQLRWDSDDLGVTFTVHDGDKAVTCHVTRAAIDDHLDYSQPGTILDRARAQFEQIAEQIRYRVKARAFEADGSIRIRTGDWRQH